MGSVVNLSFKQPCSSCKQPEVEMLAWLQHVSHQMWRACAGMVLLVFCNGLLDAWLLLSKRSPLAME